MDAITWPLAFCLVFSILILSAFTLFLVVYLKELKREKDIIKDYMNGYTKPSYVELPLVVIDNKLQSTKQKSEPVVNPSDKSKKNVN